MSVATALIGITPAAGEPSGDDAATTSVIVVLRDQLTSTPATPAQIDQRRARAESAQAVVLDRLMAHGGPAPAKVVHYTAANALSVTVTSAQAAALAADPAVARVVPDTRIEVPVTPPAAAPQSPAKGIRAASAPAGVCPADPAKPLLEPEALAVTHTASDDPKAKTAQQLADGDGVKVAYIANGIDPDNPDLIRANGEHVITDYRAFAADGPNPGEGGAEAYGDASAIGAQGRISYDLSRFVNSAYPLPAGCNIRVLGMAPGAGIVALKIDFFNTSLIQAIDYAVTTAHVDVINESVGLNAIPDSSARAAVSVFNDMAVAAGITVVASSGDSGPTGTVESVATDPQVISVAASTTSRLYAQTGYGGARTFGSGGWVNNEISSLSSGGISQRGRSVDLTAPGDGGWALCDAGTLDCQNYRGGTSNLQAFGGTSQSAPLTAGAAALVIQAYRSSHGGDSPSPRLVKRLLASTATDLGLPPSEQGAGLLNSRAAVEAALTYPGATKAPGVGVGSHLVLSTSQLTISGSPGSRHTRTVSVRNAGTRRLTVKLGSRDFVTRAQTTQTATLAARSDPTFPFPTTGAPWAYRKVTFSVPAGTDRLAAAMIWQGTARAGGAGTITPVVRLTLIQPNGRYVTSSRPQGGGISSNYANLDVRSPAAGRWTAVFHTVASASGYTGPVTLQTTAQRAVSAARVRPAAFGLNPGQARTVKIRLRVPPSSGDRSQAITVRSSEGQRTAVGVNARAVVPTGSGTGHFRGLITGGNARPGAPAQTLTYAFTVPKGKRDLQVGVTLAHDAGIRIVGALVDPNEETQSVGSNAYSDVARRVTGQGRTMQLSTSSPIPGRWRLVITVQNPVTGNELGERFTGEIGFDRSRARTVGLPTSTSTRLGRGIGTRGTVTVTNTGIAPIRFQLDPRTTEPTEVALRAIGGSGDVTLPGHGGPTVLVPPGTTGLTASSAATRPALVTLQAGNAGILVAGDLTAGKAGSTVSVARLQESTGTISTGFWFTDVNQIGPIGAGGSPPGTARVTVQAKTPGFDDTVKTSTGDVWATAVDPKASVGTPARIEPGASSTVTVIITPTAPVGTKVTGVLYVVTPPAVLGNLNPTGDVLTAIPYAYTVGRPPASTKTTSTR